MAVTATPAFVQVPKNYKVQILPADTNALKTVATGGTNGTKIVSLVVTSSDTTNRDVSWGITTGGTFWPMGTTTVLATAGTVNNVATTNLFNATNSPGLPVDGDGNFFVFLSGTSDTLQIQSTSTVTTAKSLNVTAMGADF